MYGVTELEALGVVWAMKHFQSYLIGQKCRVYTDHAPLKSMLYARHQTGKLARWSNMLEEVDLEICADPLSRAPMEEPTDHYEREVANISASSTNEQSASEIATLQQCDPTLQPILAYLEKKELPADKRKHAD